MNLYDLHENKKLQLYHSPWFYDYLHSLRMNFEHNTFEVLIGGGQCIEHIYAGNFIDNGKILILEFKSEKDIYDTQKYKLLNGGSVIIESAYTITQEDKVCFNGYSKQNAKYTVTFDKDPFYYGNRKETLFNIVDGGNVSSDTNIFYTHLEYVECDVEMERSVRDSMELCNMSLELNEDFPSLIFPEISILTCDEIENVLKKIKDNLSNKRNITQYSLIYKSPNRYIFYVGNACIDLTKTTLDVHGRDGKNTNQVSDDAIKHIQYLSGDIILSALFP